MAWLILGFVLASGCHNPPLVRSPVRIASVSFEYGTNATIQIDRHIEQAGVYDLHVKFRKADMPHDAEGRWPSMLKARFRILVLTNGTARVERDLESLNFNSSRDPEFVRYGLTPFSLSQEADVRCIVRDMSDGKLKMRGVLIFERRSLK